MLPSRVGQKLLPTSTSNKIHVFENILHLNLMTPDRSSLSYTIDTADKLSIDTDCEICPTIYLNKTACVFLAKLLLQMGLGSARKGYHLHLGQNFEPDEAEALRIVIVE
jgi:hypothetical protein